MAIEQKKERNKQYRLEHPEYDKQYYEVHKEEILAYMKQYYEVHKEEILEYHKQYYKVYEEEIRKCTKQYYEAHKEEVLARDKQWKKLNPEKVKEAWKKHFNKRNRNLGFIPLNKSFKGSVAHHFDPNYIGYMDRKDHESIRHCLETGRNMAEINALAFNYIGGR